MKSWVVIGLIIGLLIIFGISLLMTKGIIWVALELFKIDWRDKFWAVFVAFWILTIITGGIGKANTKS